jgi:hypothetical protein
MSPPLIRMFGRGARVYVKAQQAWLILVAHVMSTSGASKNRRLTYGELAERMGLDRRAGIGLAPVLGIIGEYCKQNGLPAINCLVVSQETGTPGPGVVFRKGRSWRDDQRDAIRVNWFQYRVPTTGTFRQVWEAMSR